MDISDCFKGDSKSVEIDGVSDLFGGDNLNWNTIKQDSLDDLNNNECKIKFAVFDAETDPFKHGADIQPFIWGYYDGKEYNKFYSTEEFLQFLSEIPLGYRNKRLRIYAHNGGKFDTHFLLEHLEAEEIGQNILTIHGRIASIDIFNVTILDSYLLLPVALAKLQKLEIDYRKLAKECRAEHMDEIEEYLEFDCLSLYNHLEEFFIKYGYSLTLAGAAFNQWRKISKRKPPQLKGAAGQVYYDFFSNWYYGGRVQCFETGVFHGSFKFPDINSAYPAQMKNKLHPISLTFKEVKNPTDEEIEKGFYLIDANSRGALPCRTKDGLDFPMNRSGLFYASGHEIIAGIETGTLDINKIYSGFVFDEYITFADYVDHFYDLKNKSEKGSADYTFSKLFLNSIYGRWAMNSQTYKQTYITAPDMYPDYIYEIAETCEEDAKLEAGFLTNIACFDDFWIWETDLDEDKQKYFNVATAASITASVRAYMWRSINKVKRPLYCDTDSIICEDTGSLHLSDKLGDWDIEATGDMVAIAGKKMYAFRTHEKKKNGRRKFKIATKGVDLHPKQIIKVANGGVVKWYNKRPTFSLKKSSKFEYINRTIKKNEKTPIFVDINLDSFYNDLETMINA